MSRTRRGPGRPRSPRRRLAPQLIAAWRRSGLSANAAERAALLPYRSLLKMLTGAAFPATQRRLEGVRLLAVNLGVADAEALR